MMPLSLRDARLVAALMILLLPVGLWTGSGRIYEQTAPPVEHAIAGTLQRVEPTTRTLVMVADDRERRLFWTDDTVVHGCPTGGTVADLARHPGTTLVVRYTCSEMGQTATTIRRLASTRVRRVEGTLDRIDYGRRLLHVTLPTGIDRVFVMPEDVVIESESGVVALPALMARTGDRVIVFYTAEPHRDVVWLLTHVTPRPC